MANFTRGMCLTTSSVASALTKRITKTVKLVVVQVRLLICLLSDLGLVLYVPVSFERFYFLFTVNIYSKTFLCLTFCGYHMRFFITIFGLYFEDLEIPSFFYCGQGSEFTGKTPKYSNKNFLLRL